MDGGVVSITASFSIIFLSVLKVKSFYFMINCGKLG